MHDEGSSMSGPTRELQYVRTNERIVELHIKFILAACPLQVSRLQEAYFFKWQTWIPIYSNYYIYYRSNAIYSLSCAYLKYRCGSVLCISYCKDYTLYAYSLSLNCSKDGAGKSDEPSNMDIVHVWAMGNYYLSYGL